MDSAPSRASTQFLSFVDYGEQSRAGYPFYHPFPKGTAVKHAGAACTESNSPYDWWRWIASSATDPNPKWFWSPQPDSQPFFRDPGSLNVSKGVFDGVRGLRFTGMFGGRINSNDDPSPVGQKHSNLVQSIFYHQRLCYDGGPEMGFVRVIINPSHLWEEGRLYFYISEITNCFGDPNAGQTSCLERSTKTWKTGSTIGMPGTFPVPDTSNPNYWWLPIPCYASDAVANVASKRYPAGARLCENSAGTHDWTFSARLNGPAQFILEIFDPNGNIPVYRKTVNVPAIWQQRLTTSMSQGDFWGYLTLTSQKSLGRDAHNNPRGNITPDLTDYPAIAVKKIEALAAEIQAGAGSSHAASGA